MVATMRRELLGVLLVAVLVAGLVDAVVSGAWDLVAVFAFALVVSIAVVWRTQRGRRLIGVRPDLARWVEEEAVTRGERVEAMVDRCIATYRAGLIDED